MYGCVCCKCRTQFLRRWMPLTSTDVRELECKLLYLILQTIVDMDVVSPR